MDSHKPMPTIALLLLLASPALAQVTGHADYLYWQANSSDFRFRKANPYVPDYDGLAAQHDGSSGVRTGIGYRFHKWEVSWNFTYYASDARDEWEGWFIDSDQGGTSNDDLDYQVHDFQITRSFCVGQCCELGVFGGFRWGQVDRHAQDDWIDGIAYPYFVYYDTSISKTDSYGGRLGGNFRVQLTDSLSWFATGAFSGLVSTTEKNSFEVTNIVGGDMASMYEQANSQRDTHETHSVEAATGLSWTHGSLELAAGYEWHVWSNIIHRRRIYVGYEDYRDLVLDGLFARVALTY